MKARKIIKDMRLTAPLYSALELVGPLGRKLGLETEKICEARRFLQERGQDIKGHPKTVVAVALFHVMEERKNIAEGLDVSEKILKKREREIRS